MRGVTIPQDHHSVRDKSRAWRQSVPAERSGKANTQPRIVHTRAARATWPGRVFIHCLPAIGSVTLLSDKLLPDQPGAASVPIRRSCSRFATATSLSPAARGNVKVPFSSEHRPSGAFLAPSSSNRFSSAYTSFPFTNTHSSRVHPISTFFVCFLSEIIVVFSHATARFGQRPAILAAEIYQPVPLRADGLPFLRSIGHFVIHGVLTARQPGKL